MHYKKWIVALVLALPAGAWADLLVVTSVQSPLTTLKKEQVRQLYVGRKNAVGSVAVTPLDLPEGDAVRKAFYLKATGKSPDQVRSYWARMIFTGKGMPPRTVSGTAELLGELRQHHGHIGYLPEEKLTDELKVLLRLP